MDRLLFIVPPYVDYNHYVTPSYNERTVTKNSHAYGSVVTDMPLGLLSLSSYIKHRFPIDIKILDFNIILNKLDTFVYKDFAELFHETLSSTEWLTFSPSIIGISALFTPSYANMIDIARVVKPLYPNALIIAGGGVPTNMYRKIMDDSPCFDALCYGEGEIPLLELVKSDDRSSLLQSHPSWITKDNIATGHTYYNTLIDNLDDIPFYDYSLLDTDAYQLSPTISTIVAFEHSSNKMPLFHIATSRGCPHHCCYCASHTVHGRRMRYHGFKRIAEDLERLKNQYRAELICIQDDNFMADKNRALNIIHAANDLQMKVFFQSGLPLYALDRNTLESMKRAGINEIVLPIESGSNRVLREIMHKPLDLSIVKRVISDCRRLEIDTDANILIGLPGETKQDIEDTRQFLKTLDATWFRIYVATPLVGSEMFDICVQNNYLKGDHIGSDFKRAVVETEHFTAEYIQEKAYSLNLELNFVENSDVRLGNYRSALKGFENTIRIKDDHAFAYYFAAKCRMMMGEKSKALEYYDKYHEIVKKSQFWEDYADHFNLGSLE